MKLLAPFLTLAGCYGLFFIYLAATYDLLPVRMASHFDINGQPNGWMSREAWMGVTLVMGVGLPALIVGIMAVASYLPGRLINIPHRDYWLAPERRGQTSAMLIQLALWLACLLVLFVTSVQWLVVRANETTGGGHLSTTNMLIVVSTMLAGTLLWLVLVHRKFALKISEPY